MSTVYMRNPKTNEFELVGFGAATTDTTLSQSGKPADAAAVGAALSNYATVVDLDSQIFTKVDKVDGKGLSTNDYTNTDKTKLDKLNTFFSNPNLLINSDFRKPINQRGQTSYSIPSYTYTIDRWKVLSNAATLSVNNGYIKLSSNSTTSSFFIQKTESVPVDDYITVSINVKSLTGALNVYIAGTSQEECFSIYSTGIVTYTTSNKFSNFMQLNIETINDAQVELYWAKVEQGSIVTPFVSRLYAEELALCKRYYEKRIIMFTPLGGTTPATYYIAVNGGQHFAEMRVTATASAGVLYNQNGVDSGASVKAFTQTSNGLRMIQLESSCSNYALRSTVEFDAEFY